MGGASSCDRRRADALPGSATTVDRAGAAPRRQVAPPGTRRAGGQRGTPRSPRSGTCSRGRCRAGSTSRGRPRPRSSAIGARRACRARRTRPTTRLHGLPPEAAGVGQLSVHSRSVVEPSSRRRAVRSKPKRQKTGRVVAVELGLGRRCRAALQHRDLQEQVAARGRRPGAARTGPCRCRARARARGRTAARRGRRPAGRWPAGRGAGSLVGPEVVVARAVEEPRGHRRPVRLAQARAALDDPQRGVKVDPLGQAPVQEAVAAVAAARGAQRELDVLGRRRRRPATGRRCRSRPRPPGSGSHGGSRTGSGRGRAAPELGAGAAAGDGRRCRRWPAGPRRGPGGPADRPCDTTLTARLRRGPRSVHDVDPPQAVASRGCATSGHHRARAALARRSANPWAASSRVRRWWGTGGRRARPPRRRPAARPPGRPAERVDQPLADLGPHPRHRLAGPEPVEPAVGRAGGPRTARSRPTPRRRRCRAAPTRGRTGTVQPGCLGRSRCTACRWSATARRAAGSRSPSALLTTIDVGQLHDPPLDALQLVAAPGGGQQDEAVDHVGHDGLGLADADRLDEHHVEAGGLAQQGGLTGAPGHATERASRRRRTDEGRRVAGEAFHAGLVAHDRSAAAPARRVDRQHGHPVPGGRQVRAQLVDERRLARPGVPLMPTRAAPPVAGNTASSSPAAAARRSARSTRRG